MPERSRRRCVDYEPKHESLEETIKRVIENIGKRGSEPEFKTGLEALDLGTFGLHKSQLTVLAARPGQGKTSAACQIAYNLSDSGHKVAFISLELTRETLIEKIFCLTNRVNSRKLMMNQMTDEEKFKMDYFLNIMKLFPFKIIDDFCFTEDELYTLIEHLEMRPDVLILDHIQHIRTDDARFERETLNNYLRYLKEIAMKFQMAILVLSQINRQGDDKPTLANLKGTGSIEEIADAVIILHQKNKKTVFTENNGDMIECVMDIAKNRFGPIGYFDVIFEASTGRFLNMSNIDQKESKEEIPNWQK